jgi:cathepsin L
MTFIVEQGRSSVPVEEYEARLEIFMKNDLIIEQHNSRPSTYKLAHNKFSDRTEYEMNKMLKAGTVSRQEPRVLPITNDTFTPINWIDLNAVNAIQDQGSCGSCWAFSTICGMEGGHAVQTGELLKFSEQQLVDCSTENNGCHGGMSYDGYHYFLTHGPMLETQYPYTAKDGVCQYD